MIPTWQMTEQDKLLARTEEVRALLESLVDPEEPPTEVELAEWAEPEETADEARARMTWAERQADVEWQAEITGCDWAWISEAEHHRREAITESEREVTP